MVPSRVFVSVVVFGLIAALMVLAYAALVLSGYEPPPESPYELLFPEPDNRSGAAWAVFLTLAAGISLVFTVLAWRALVQGARRDARRRKAYRQMRRDTVEYQRQRRGGPPMN